MLDVSSLGFFCAQEFPARRKIVKKLTDFHAGPRRDASGFDF
jgi:hypothetical protein